MVKPFEDALFAMKAGEIVGPIKTEFGYHVLQLREIKGGEGRSFEDVRDQLAAEQLQADTEAAFNDLSGRLVDLVYKNPTALEPFTRETASGIATSPAVLKAAFSVTLVEDGTVSDSIEIAPNRSVMIRVTSHTPEQATPLAQAREQVIAAVRANRAKEAQNKA